MPKGKRNHPDYYYDIRDGIVLLMGTEFDENRFRGLFREAARPHKLIPFGDGYLAHLNIIRGLVKDKMAAQKTSPEVQTIQYLWQSLPLTKKPAAPMPDYARQQLARLKAAARTNK